MAQCRTEKVHDFPSRQQSRTAQTRCCAAMRRVWPVCSGCRLHGSLTRDGKMFIPDVFWLRSLAASTKRAVKSRCRRATCSCRVTTRFYRVGMSGRSHVSSRSSAAMRQSYAVISHCSTHAAFTHARGLFTQTATWGNVVAFAHINAEQLCPATARSANALLRSVCKPAVWPNAPMMSRNVPTTPPRNAAMTTKQPATFRQ
jgi:hypothetical protein